MIRLNFTILFLGCFSLCQSQSSIVIPKPHQLKWHEAEMGAVFHYDLHVLAFDTDQWVQAVQAAGCKFAILTATRTRFSTYIVD